MTVGRTEIDRDMFICAKSKDWKSLFTLLMNYKIITHTELQKLEKRTF